ncbi:MAG: amino acid-binding protein [Actinomycetota bacterium]|nr:amino acid-binding protein [Actinomycetota bacterium]
MSYVLRVQLPDRPGALGAVATALGTIGADIMAMDIVERSPGTAIDDLVVDLPRGRAPDTLITAAESVDGVRVESVRPDPGIADAHREWELVEAVAADPEHAVETLAELLPDVLRAGWAAVVRVTPERTIEVLGSGGGVPSFDGVVPGWAPLTGPKILDSEENWVPEPWRAVGTEMAAAPLGAADVSVIVGRPGGPAMRRSEVARLAHLAMLAAVVSGRAPALGSWDTQH